MSEERFDRLEAKVSGIQTDVQQLKVDVRQLKTDVSDLKTDVAEVKTDVAELKIDVAQIKGDISELRVGQLSLDHQMRILHEDVIQNIKAIPDARATMRQEIRAAFTELRDEFDGRVGPLELTVREHSIEIARLKEGRS